MDVQSSSSYGYDLGSFHRAVSSRDGGAQAWFDRGLIWSYAFNHEESAACFEKAILLDPSCVMAYWGLAYALGPNYNKPWQSFDEDEFVAAVKRTHDAVQKAEQNLAFASPVEKALVRALSCRYPQSGVAGPDNYAIWNAAYATEMRAVYELFPGDLDVAALYADSLMNLTPWGLWDIHTGKVAPGARTIEAKAVLERALEEGMHHPGLLHLYIHLMEMSPTPEIALNAADCLRGLVPDAGHLQHMPTHLDILCGDYRRAIASNSDAIVADKKFLSQAGSMNFYSLYRAHNYHFRIYAAMFAGQSKVALETVSQLEASIPIELLRVESPPMADWLEGFLSIRMHVLIRFGRWKDILDLKFPHDQKLYSVTTAMTHYARGIALAATGFVNEAETERNLLIQTLESVQSSRTIFNNSCIDILAIAQTMLKGEIEYRRGHIESAFEHLNSSILLEDSLPYDEPWGWMQPIRHAYAALLLEQGRVEQARDIYSADLGLDESLPRARQHPKNVFALHGLHECLTRLGRTSEARIIGQELRLSQAVADVNVTSSCFCRLGVADSSDLPCHSNSSV